MTKKKKKAGNVEKGNYRIDRVNVSAVVHSTEDMEKVGEAMAELFPFEFEIEVSRAKGHYGNELTFLEVELKDRKKIREFLRYIFERLKDSGELDYLKETLEDRIDAGNVLHLRFDKQRAYLGELILGSSDPIAVKIKITTFPSKKEIAVKAIKEMMDEVNGKVETDVRLTDAGSEN